MTLVIMEWEMLPAINFEGYYLTIGPIHNTCSGFDGLASPIYKRKFGIRLLTVVHFPQMQKWLKYSMSAGAPKPYRVYKEHGRSVL